ncbi:MAG: coniferyl aldehyde dehydrogenase [Tatlockia sp.]|jgi:coniferyl-aldehyde dehydrogenase
MNNLFAHLQKKHEETPYLPLPVRRKILKQLRHLLQENAYLLAEAISKDFTFRSQEETFFLELLPTVSTIDYCLKHLKSWAKPRKRHTPWYFTTAKAYVFPQPLGVIGIMVPWNYPIFLSVIPAIFALSAGNRVMIKMSEYSPNMGKLLSKIIKNNPVLKEMIVVVNGNLEVAKAFSGLPFDHLLFTGSAQVGKYIMEEASNHLTPITLELGGKSPVIVSTTADSKHFDRIFMGKLFNAGQTCLASDYLLIPEGWEAKIEAHFRQFMAARFPDLLENEAYTAVISKASMKRLNGLLEDARKKGGKIITIGQTEGYKGNKMPVNLILNANPSMLVMQEEIFGPLLPVMTYKSFEKAVEWINSMPKPLALYYFGNSEKEKRLVKNNVLSGATVFNDTLMHAAIHDLPFGGVGASGMGQYHGQEGFDGFSKLKPVLEQSRFNFGSFIYPPYHKWIRVLLLRLAGIKHKRG